MRRLLTLLLVSKSFVVAPLVVFLASPVQHTDTPTDKYPEISNLESHHAWYRKEWRGAS